MVVRVLRSWHLCLFPIHLPNNSLMNKFISATVHKNGDLLSDAVSNVHRVS